MRHDEIIQLAKQAGLKIRGYYDENGSTPSELQRFVDIIVSTKLCQLEQLNAQMLDVLRLLTSVEFGHLGWNDAAARAAEAAKKIPEVMDTDAKYVVLQHSLDGHVAVSRPLTLQEARHSTLSARGVRCQILQVIDDAPSWRDHNNE